MPMFPLRDTVPARRLPAAVWALVFVNVAIFLHQVQLTPRELMQFISRYAMIPARLTAPGGLEQFWPTVTTAWTRKAIRQVEETVFGLVRDRLGKNEDESSRAP